MTINRLDYGVSSRYLPRPVQALAARRVMWRNRVLAVALALLPWAMTPAAETPPVIAAASNLIDALNEIALRFTSETGNQVRLSFGSSTNLARQIRQGAPFQLFFSADEEQVLALARDGYAEDNGLVYAGGRLVLFVPKGSPIKADPELRDLAAALRDGRLQRLAIANPEHAPYGQRAQDVLIHAGLWPLVKDKLVLGENIGQATQFTLSGSVEAGLIALSLARSPRLNGHGHYAVVPRSWHRPLRQRMVLTPDAGETARQFYLYIKNPPARAILQRYGFDVPSE